MIYGAKSITRFDRLKNEDGNPAFEERVVILNSNSQNEAIELAEAEAKNYATVNKGFYLGWIAVYEARESDVAFEGIQEVKTGTLKNCLVIEVTKETEEGADKGTEWWAIGHGEVLVKAEMAMGLSVRKKKTIAE